MSKTVFSFVVLALLLAGCMSPGIIPPQNTALDPEPRTMMLSEMCAELGWTYQMGPGPYQYVMRSPQGDQVTFERGRDLVIINSTRWRQERDAVENRFGNDLMLPESTFNFICRRFGQHHLLRGPMRTASLQYELAPLGRAPEAPPQQPAQPVDGPLKGLIICIDPGHGGKDPGGMANGVVEKEICLAVSLLLRDLCKQAGATVIMTRTDDSYPELDERCRIANDANAHLFISIHANIAPNSDLVTGFEAFYKGGARQSELFARTLIAAMAASTDSPNRGAKVDPRGLRVLENTNMPAVLFELGFMSNPQEARRLVNPEYQRQQAQALFTGIAYYWTRSRASVGR
jgi:N-acetylmuramoyl-L-alanine amidase